MQKRRDLWKKVIEFADFFGNEFRKSVKPPASGHSLEVVEILSARAASTLIAAKREQLVN